MTRTLSNVDLICETFTDMWFEMFPNWRTLDRLLCNPLDAHAVCTAVRVKLRIKASDMEILEAKMNERKRSKAEAN